MNTKLVLTIASILAGAQATLYTNSSTPVNFVTADYPGATEIGVSARCPNLNFGFVSQSHTAYPQAHASITNALSVGDNKFEITLQFNGDNCPPISNLDQAAIIGFNSPESSSYLLYDSNQKVHNINDSCNWAAKFVVDGIETDGLVCVPNFQIHYAWFSGLAKSDHAAGFPYHSAYEYSMNCVSDNNYNAQSDFSQYCFDINSSAVSSSLLPSDLYSNTSSSAPPSSAIPTTSSEPSCLALWSQCGGQNWSGSTECCAGECKVFNEYYAQCIPIEATTLVESTTSDTSSSAISIASSTSLLTSLTITSSSVSTPELPLTTKSPHQPLYGQCGGQNWNGATVCVEGATCSSMNPWYHQCVSEPIPTSVVGLYGQCGGKDWQGPVACVRGASCSSMNPWYSQCIQTAH